MKVMEGFHKLGDDLEKVIEKDDGNSSTTTESDCEAAAHKMPSTVRERVRHLVHTNKFQIIIICLVILDCLLVVGELLIDLAVINLHEDNPAPHVLHYMSIGILSLFLVELAVKIYAMRLEFFKSKMEVFDGIVVIVSFVLDVYYAQDEGALEGVGLLVMLRLWRVTRIINGIVLSVKSQAEKRLAKERKFREALEQELTKFREYCTNQEQEIELLQGLLRKHGIEFAQKEKPVTTSKINVIAEVNQVKVTEANQVNEKTEMSIKGKQNIGGDTQTR